jgi:hypothetical protein
VQGWKDVGWLGLRGRRSRIDDRWVLKKCLLLALLEVTNVPEKYLIVDLFVPYYPEQNSLDWIVLIIC